MRHKIGSSVPLPVFGTNAEDLDGAMRAAVLKSEVLLGASEERQAWVRWWYRRLAAGGGSRVATSAVDARSTACAIVPS